MDNIFSAHYLPMRYEREKPSRQMYSETKQLLKDFNINVAVPQFKSCAEMLNWRRQKIFEKVGAL